MNTSVHVELREVQDSDVALFFAHRRDPAAAAMAAFASRDLEAFHLHWTRLLKDPQVTTRCIVADGQPAGNVGSFVKDHTRLVGYWLDRNRWGQGIATQALQLFLRVDTTRPLHAFVATHNAGSRRVLEKCGFRVLARTMSTNERGEPMEELHLTLS